MRKIQRLFILLTRLFFLIVISVSFAIGQDGNSVRKPTAAGTFYPGERNELEKKIDGYFNESPIKEVKNSIIGMIVPHAGLDYSGKIAADGYKLVKGNTYDAVIIVAPSHMGLSRLVQVKRGGVTTIFQKRG